MENIQHVSLFNVRSNLSSIIGRNNVWESKNSRTGIILHTGFETDIPRNDPLRVSNKKKVFGDYIGKGHHYTNNGFARTKLEAYL